MDDSTILSPGVGQLTALPEGSHLLLNAQLLTGEGVSGNQMDIDDNEGDGMDDEAGRKEDDDDCCGNEEWNEVDDEEKPETFVLPNLHIGIFGDSCLGRIKDSEIYRTGGQNMRKALEANSNNVKYEEIGGFVRRGVFEFLGLPDVLQLRILEYIVEPFKTSGQLKCEIRLGRPRTGRRTRYELILSPMKQGYAEVDVTDSEGKDWLMFDLLRHATSVCKRFRLDIDTLLWQNVRLYVGTECSPELVLDFFTRRPGIWKEIKEFKIDVRDDLNRNIYVVLAFEKLCRFASQHLELTRLEVDLEISYDEYTWIQSGVGYLTMLKALVVTEHCDFTRCRIKLVDGKFLDDSKSPKGVHGLRCREVLKEKILPSLRPGLPAEQSDSKQDYLAERAKVMKAENERQLQT